MAVDENLHLARRLGYGLSRDEDISPSVRDWAVRQVSAVAPLGFVGPNGTSVRDLLGEDADPFEDFASACRSWAVYRPLRDELKLREGTMTADRYEELLRVKLFTPYGDIPRWRDCLARTLTAVYGESPVFERFWSFWVNHFTVSAADPDALQFYGPHTRAIRQRMTGAFADLLHDAILNPAMLQYLNNIQSTGPHSIAGRRSNTSLNENLAREILELHTLSPGHYTQADVIEAALVLTGWTFYAGEATHAGGVPGDPFGAYFDAAHHEPGNRRVVDRIYPTRDDGSQAAAMLADLAAHPATATHLSFKLARHFIADVPPEDSVERIRATWLATGGDLVAVHTAVIDEVIAKAGEHRKFTTPDVWFLQALRVIGGVPLTKPYGGAGQYWIDAIFAELGQSYCHCPQPNGWSDLASDWLSVGMIDRRVRIAHYLGSRMDPALRQELADYAARLAGEDSDLAALVRQSDKGGDAAAFLFASPQFLRM